MGTLYFSQMNGKLENMKTELQSKCLINNNLDVPNIVKENPAESKLIQKRRCQCGSMPLIVSGLFFTMLGLLSIKFTFTDIILTARLKMQPGFPAYEAWLNPTADVRLNVYIFTVENAAEFLSGTDSKIKIKEIGPIVYREYLQHRDVVFHKNSTLSYTPVRWTEFVPHANKPGILNETITVPNFAILAAGGFVNMHNYFLQIGYNYIHKKYNEGLFINVSIYDYLWNYKSPLLQKAQDFAPSMVPTLNTGILYSMYENIADRYNVRIGPEYGDSDFFLINTVNGVPTVPGYNVENGDCNASVQNSTEGAMYRQRLTKKSVLKFWRKAICRTVSLHFDKEVKIGDISTYKYTLASDVYDRLPNKEADCYKGVYQELQDGLTDVSKCYYDMPFAASLPHFYGRSEGITQKFEGLHPNKENHSSFTYVEPIMGAPIMQAARSQMNLVIPKFSNLFGSDYHLFSDMILPLFWVEFAQQDLPPDLLAMVAFFANMLPIYEVAVTITLLLLGFTLTVAAFAKLFRSKWNLLTETKTHINFKIVERSTGII